jgi:LmbE family N-acetylglucosaminyl deacetylase
MITKIQAAERQLDTAIKLFFENVDRLSCYTLAAASREITDDLCEKRKSELYRGELERLGDPQLIRLSFRDEMEILIKPEHIKEAMRLLKKPQNFLKHADRDHDKHLDDISAEEVSLLIFSAVRNFALLEKRSSPAMSIFLCWFTTAHPDLINTHSADYHNLRELAAKMKKVFPDVYSQLSFHTMYRILRAHAPGLFAPNQD